MRAADTTAAAEAVQLAVLRAMTPSQRFAIALAMSDAARQTALDGIRARHPDYDQRTAARRRRPPGDRAAPAAALAAAGVAGPVVGRAALIVDGALELAQGLAPGVADGPRRRRRLVVGQRARGAPRIAGAAAAERRALQGVGVAQLERGAAAVDRAAGAAVGRGLAIVEVERAAGDGDDRGQAKEANHGRPYSKARAIADRPSTSGSE